jgi:hypothetical protein
MKMEQMEHKHALEILSATKQIEELRNEVSILKEKEERSRYDLEQHRTRIMEQKTKETQQIEKLTKEIEEHKTWVEVVKNKKPQEKTIPHQDIAQEVQQILSEEKDRLRRANNLTLRGIPEPKNETPTHLQQVVQTTLRDKFDQPGLEILHARRVGKDNERGKGRLIIFSVDQSRKRSLLSTKLQFLKGSDLFLDDDRTPQQQEEYRKTLQERWKKRQHPNPRATPPPDK